MQKAWVSQAFFFYPEMALDWRSKALWSGSGLPERKRSGVGRCGWHAKCAVANGSRVLTVHNIVIIHKLIRCWPALLESNKR